MCEKVAEQPLVSFTGESSMFLQLGLLGDQKKEEGVSLIFSAGKMFYAPILHMPSVRTLAL